MDHKAKARLPAQLGLFELLFIYFRRLLRNPATAITMLLLLQTLLVDQAEAKSFDWDEVPEALDLDADKFSFSEVPLEVTDLSETVRVDEITGLQVEDVTASYRRFLTEENSNSTSCLAPPEDRIRFSLLCVRSMDMATYFMQGMSRLMRRETHGQ